MADLICIGAIMGAFGVHGEVRLKSFTSEPDAIGDYSPLLTEGGKREFKVQLTRQIPQGFAARLSDVRSREEAEALKGTKLYVPRDQLPSLPDDEFYHADLIGLDVKAVLNHGAGDIHEIWQKGAKNTLLLPFTLAAVPTVDLKARRIVADPPAEVE